MKALRVVMKKELDRVFHDKKLVFSLFILPAVMMIALYGLMGMLAGQMMADIAEHESIVYVVNAPSDFKNLVLEDSDLVWNDAAADQVTALKEEVRAGEADLMIVFPEQFSESVANFQAGDPVPEIKTYYNPADDYSSNARDIFGEYYFPEYEEQLLKERFSDLSVLTPFVVDSAEGQEEESSIVTNEGQAEGQFLGMLFPYLIVMLLFTGPMSLGVDAIAGEKERGTLASMLITPAPRRDIVLGKLFSLEILSFLSAIVYALSMIIAIPFLAGDLTSSASGVKSLVNVTSVLEIILVMVALVFLYVAVVATLSVRAKSIKEASSTVSVIYILVVVAGVMTMFSGNTDPALWRYEIPVYGSALCIQKVITGGLTLPAFLVSTLVTLALGAVLTWMITRAFDDERVVMNA
ncbi:MAG: ABC transporter permease [Lachnospiraceae bacterium]|nr:ABC transporter permease [Lachnospiraceae bacterium]